MGQTVYQFTLTGITGQPIVLADYSGRKLLLVNTASACGYTPQYKQLEELHQQYKDKLVVIGLPCNDFGSQEQGSETAIQHFCEVNYAITFPLTAKVKIVAPGTHPLYNYLTKKELNGNSDSEVVWNFQKYLVDEKGYLIKVFSPAVEPLSEELLNAIEQQ